MPTLLLNTIALDPNRWTPEKQPYFRLADLLPSLAGAGFRHLEVWQYHLSTLAPGEVAALREAARAHGVAFGIVGLYPALHLTGTAADAERAEMHRLIAEASRLGADAVKIFAGRLGSARVDEAAYARSVAFARDLAGAAARHGLTLNVETHPDTLCDTLPACHRFLDDVDAPNLRVCFQPFDFADTARTVADYDALHEHVVHVHLQGRRDDRMSLLEAADLDYAPLFEALARHRFDGALCIEFVEGCVVDRPEDFDLEHVLASARRDRAFIHRTSAAAEIEVS